jgi:hypothetical protein
MNGPPLLKDKDKPKKDRPKTSAQLTKLLDAVYSKYIRTLYSINGYVECYTCGKVKLISEMQCGHFVSRRHYTTRWDERNTRPQCWGCNAKHLGNGMPVVFAAKLVQEYGKKIISELYRLANQAFIAKEYPFKEKIEFYKKKLEKLSNG